MSVITKLTPEERAQVQELRKKCRLRRHWMDDYVPPFFEKTGAFHGCKHILHWRCETCGTVRHDGLSGTGELWARRYEYPDGYKLDTDEERPTADDLRMWLIKRNRAAGIPSAPTTSPKASVKLSVSEQLKAASRG